VAVSVTRVVEGSARALFPDEMARDFGSLPDPDA